MTMSHEQLIEEILPDLRKRAVLGHRWEQRFRIDATEYLQAISARSKRLRAVLGTWAYSAWAEYESLARAEAERARAERQQAEELAQAPFRERRERFWASLRARADSATLRRDVQARGIEVVYHWTEAENLPSILRHGLRSRAGLRALGITPQTHSYGSVAKEAQLASYVGIMLRPHEGMIRRADDPIVLELEPGVLAIDGALFVPGNSARRDLDITNRGALSTLDAFASLFDDDIASRLRDWQSEVWIPQYLSPLAITAVAARSSRTHDQLRATWDSHFAAWPYPVTLLETDAWNQLTRIDIDAI
jgi:hypothetical protein